MVPRGRGLQQAVLAEGGTKLSHHRLNLGAVNVDPGCPHELRWVKRLIALEKPFKGVTNRVFVSEVWELALWPVVHSFTVAGQTLISRSISLRACHRLGRLCLRLDREGRR